MARDQRADELQRRDRWPADQQFGASAAEDQDRVDGGASEQDIARSTTPRAANKADVAR